MIAGMPSQPTRRSAVRAGGLGALVLGLSACGIRLEADAPRIPLVPTRTPRPGEAGLRALLDHGTDVVAACEAWTGPGAAPAATLGGVVRAQDTTLAALLAAAGAPTTSPTTPTASATTAATRGSAATTGRVAAAAVATLPALRPIEADLLPTVASILASRVAWATILGQPDALATVAPPSGPTATANATPASTPTAPGVGWLEATWAAQYAFEVVTARSAGDQRLRGRRSLELLDRSEAAQLAALATTPPPKPIGFDLPFAVSDAASARRLAVHAGEGLRTAYGAQLDGPLGADPLLTAARWLSVAERTVLGWGGKAAAFPGLMT